MNAAVFTLLVAFAATSQRPAPTPAKSGQEQQQKATLDQTKAENHQRDSTHPAPVVHEPGASAATNEKKNDTTPHDQQPTDSWPKWTAIFVAIFTGALVLLGVLQWYAMHKQSKAMLAQLAEMKSGGEDTHRLALAAQESAEAATKQVEVMQQQAITTASMAEATQASANAAKETALTSKRALELVERASMMITSIALDEWDGFLREGNTVAVTIKNDGRSRASAIIYWIELEMLDATGSLLSNAGLGNLPATLEAGGVIRRVFPTLSKITLDQPAVLDKLNFGAGRLRVRFRITYNDIFGINHTMDGDAFFNADDGLFSVIQEQAD